MTSGSPWRKWSRRPRSCIAWLAQTEDCFRTPPPGPLPEAERGRQTFCSPSPLRGGGRGEGLGNSFLTVFSAPLQGGPAVVDQSEVEQFFLEVLRGGRLERVRDLLEQQVGELLA